MNSLTLEDYADKELLLVVADVAADDPKGWARTPDIAEKLGISGDKANNSVGIRLAWLRRFGVMDHQPPKRWRLAPFGEVFLNGALPVQDERRLAEMRPEQWLTLTRWLSQRYHEGGAPTGHLMRREWTRGTKFGG